MSTQPLIKGYPTSRSSERGNTSFMFTGSQCFDAMYIPMTSKLVSPAVTAPGLPVCIASYLLGISTCMSNGHLILKMTKIKLLILVPTPKPVILFLFPLVSPTSVNGTAIDSTDQTPNLFTP